MCVWTYKRQTMYRTREIIRISGDKGWGRVLSFYECGAGKIFSGSRYLNKLPTSHPLNILQALHSLNLNWHENNSHATVVIKYLLGLFL